VDSAATSATRANARGLAFHGVVTAGLTLGGVALLVAAALIVVGLRARAQSPS
jgi:hypothetical protein